MNKEILYQAAKDAGIDAIEMLVNKANTTSIEIFEQNVDSYKISQSKRFKFRGMYQGKLGTCVLEEDSDEHIPFIISSIIQNAEAIQSKDEVEIYGTICEYPSIDNRKNTCLDASVEEKIMLLKEIEQQLKESDARIEQVMAVSYQDIETGAQLINSKGIDAIREDAFTVISAAVLASDQEDKKSAGDVVAIKDLRELNLTNFVKKLSSDATNKLHAKQVESGMYPVLIDREAMVLLLRHLAVLFDGENAYKGISILQGKVGEQIFDSKIQIIDDPLLPDGYNSAPFDDEGVACSPKTLVEKGVLKGFLHNLKSAKLMHTTSTGNGFYGGITPTNLYIQNGDTSKDEMLQKIEKGILITELNGLHAGYNDITTQFSLQAAGYYIEHGLVSYPVNLITIAGNLRTLLQEVDDVGNDLKFDLSGVGAPSILFPSIAISGK